MQKKYIFSVLLLLFTSACQSQSLLPFSDLYEIKKSKSVLSTYTCDDLIEKANDIEFSLKNLAGLRAMARCKDYKFDFNKLTELEKKLYSAEIESFYTSASGDTKSSAEMSTLELKKALKKEKEPAVKFTLYKQLRTKLKKNSERQEYLSTSTQMYKWAQQNYKKHKKQPEAATILNEATQIQAKTFWTDDDGDTAISSLDNTIKLLAKNNPVAELYYLKGRISEEAKNTKVAVENYDLALAEIEKYNLKNLSFTLERVLWLKAWILYKEKDFANAEKSFQNLIDQTQDLSEKSRAQFYLARCLKNLNKEEEAKTILEYITQNDYFGYYGLVSYRELGRKLPALNLLKPTNTIKFDLKLEFLQPPERALFTDLIKFREYAIAEKGINLMSNGKEDELNLNLYLAQRAKIFTPLFRSFARLSNTDKIEVFANYPDLIFPQPYKDEVKEMASKTNLPSSLIYSIMKQESGFNEKARSQADAMGLMQVIPKLAKQLSRKFEIPYRGNDDLYDPAINIQLGSYELMEQVKRQNGQLTYVAAAYNAGPNALSNWLKNRKREDILEFIEEIPYDETRTYVKIIARNKVFYERISNRDTDHEFPADFLN